MSRRATIHARRGLGSRCDSATQSPGLTLAHVANRWRAAMRVALDPHGLTDWQYALLACLVWLHALEAKGLLERPKHPTDGCARVLRRHPWGSGRRVERPASSKVPTHPSSTRPRCRPAHQRFKSLVVRAAPVHATTTRAPRKRAIRAPGPRLEQGRDLCGRDTCEERPAPQAPSPRRESRGKATEDLLELLVNVIRTDERTVMHRFAVEQTAVSGEQLALLSHGPGGELGVSGSRFISRIDAE
jgi:hypothetical protein